MGELHWFRNHRHEPRAQICPGMAAIHNWRQAFQQHCGHGAHDADITPAILSGELALMTAQQPQPAADTSMAFAVLGFAIGAAFVTSIVVFSKKRTSTDMYMPLDEA